mmetsp:Transcript_14610/g.45727  ORF Transcript_14610/g.45727 Transcript_14610/m.45727 type:complete len:210 (-) Transcript_14610:381-1010(-)
MGSPRTTRAAKTVQAPAAWAFLAAAPPLGGSWSKSRGFWVRSLSAKPGSCCRIARSRRGTRGSGVAARSSSIWAMSRCLLFSASLAASVLEGTPAARSFSTTSSLPMPAAMIRALAAASASSAAGPSSRMPAQRSSTSAASTHAFTARMRTLPAASSSACLAEAGTSRTTSNTALPGLCPMAAGTSCTREGGRGTASTTSATFSCRKSA